MDRITKQLNEKLEVLINHFSAETNSNEKTEVVVATLVERISSIKKDMITMQLENHERHDRHGILVREGFEKMTNKMETLNETNQTEFRSLDKRVGTIETQRESVTTFVSKILALVGGASGFAALIDRFKHP